MRYCLQRGLRFQDGYAGKVDEYCASWYLQQIVGDQDEEVKLLGGVPRQLGQRVCVWAEAMIREDAEIQEHIK